ncbi:type I-E CRISPR-associated protein Cse1/CasA [Nitriliruptoraceae bacterium ZYF776]|nr:type I-E CRISPR-associated protein Cse1/CasA [Profundirhabdus halotolerans]
MVNVRPRRSALSEVSFDLVDEPWLPVDDDGGVREVSLAELLERAHELAGLAVTPPTMQPVLLRFLVALTLDVFGAPRSAEEWGRRFERGQFAHEEVRAYLEEHRDRFDLFHPVRPFAQVPDLETPKGETKPSSLLVPAAATGNNVPLFSPRTDGDPPRLTPSEAARYVLHTHTWDTAGIKTGVVGDPLTKSGKTTGNHVGALGRLGVLVLLGRNLFESVLLNTPIVSTGLEPDDRPTWRHDEPASAAWEPAKVCTGYRQLLTWQSRRIRLFPEVDEAGCVTVAEVIVSAGDRMVALPTFEPHTAWRRPDQKKVGDVARPLTHRAGREAWRGLDALLAISSSDDRYETSNLLEQVSRLVGEGDLSATYPLRVATSGVVYGTQSAVVEDVLGDELPLPLAALRGDASLNQFLRDVTVQVEELERAIDLLDADLRRACGGEPVPWDRGQRAGTILVHALDPYVRRLLAGLSRDPNREDVARQAWIVVARRTAEEVRDRLLDAVPPTAYVGRQEGSRHHRVGAAVRAFHRRFAAAVSAEEHAPREVG